MRYLAVFMLMAVLGVLSGCAPKICKADDTYWTGCLGEKAYGDGTFSGEWKDNKPADGQGTLTYDDGDKYVGEFKDGKFNGQGTVYWSAGSIFRQGEFKDDYFHGQGTEYNPDDGSVWRKGWWCNGNESDGPCPD